jgi:hypothetical protein
VVGSNLGQLGLDRGVIDIKTSQLCESAGGFLVFALLDVESGSLGKYDQTSEQDQCPGKLDGDRNTVTSSVLQLLGGIANDRGKQQTDRNCELVSTTIGSVSFVHGPAS